MQKGFLDSFEGKKNVWHIISDNGTESWLTQEISFVDETYAKGACKLNTLENQTKHVLFLFNNKDEEVGRYYIGKKLQGKTPEQITELKDQIRFFESWNPKTHKWVPCVGLLANKPLKDIASKAISIINTQTNKIDVADVELSSEASDEDFANAWTDEFGVEYSTDRKKLLKAPQDIVEYCIKDGTEIISDRAFIECRSLISITIPGSVKILGTWCFKGCSNLTEVYLPNKICSIPYRAFCSCFKLKRINIPDNVVKIGEEAFYACPLETISLPENVVSIGDSAFLGCDNLKSITIPSKVSEIGTNPFAGEKLKNIICNTSHFETDGVALYDRGKKRLISLFGDVRFFKVPDNVTNIGNHAFYYCQSLHSLYIPNSVNTMGDNLFFGCMSWHYVLVPNGSLEKFKTLMPKYAFKVKEGFLPQNYDAQNIEYKERQSPKDQQKTTSDKRSIYTEEMFKQEIADQEERDLLEYGTTDEKKIAQIKKDKKDNRNFWIFIILLGVIMYMIMGGIARCTGSKFDPFEDNDTEWQYKHTDRIK